MSARGITWTVEQQMVTETCCNCGMLFAMTAEFKEDRLKRRPNDQSFYCPRGHAQHYTGEPAVDALRRERDRLKQSIAYEQDETRRAREEAEHQRRRANGYKGHAARITKRAKAGVCPCCNRTFVQLARHMATQHPAFTPDAPEPQLTVVHGGKA